MLEKRKHHRVPVIKQFGKEVMIKIGNESVPGVILDLSVEGLSLFTFTKVPIGSDICLSIDLPVLKTNPINGKVIWVTSTNNMFRIGIHISSINTLDSKQINRMAIEYNDCENKIMLGAPDVCERKCTYYEICAKPQKVKN